MRDLIVRMIWEAAQNVPLVCAFLIAVSFRRQDEWLAAGVTMVVGSVIAAVIIWLTEPLIFPGHKETGRAVVGNVITFSALMLVGTLYLSAPWSSWVTDLVVGLMLAVGLAIGQEFSAGERFGFVRSLALGLSCAGSLLLVRFSIDRSLALSIVIVVAWFTLVMGLYKEIRIRTGWIPATARQATADRESAGGAG